MAFWLLEDTFPLAPRCFIFTWLLSFILDFQGHSFFLSDVRTQPRGRRGERGSLCPVAGPRCRSHNLLLWSSLSLARVTCDAKEAHPGPQKPKEFLKSLSWRRARAQRHRGSYREIARWGFSAFPHGASNNHSNLPESFAIARQNGSKRNNNPDTSGPRLKKINMDVNEVAILQFKPEWNIIVSLPRYGKKQYSLN